MPQVKRFLVWFDGRLFREEKPFALGIFRILFGFWLVVYFLLNMENWERFYGAHAVVSLQRQLSLVKESSMSVFAYVNETSLWVVFWLGAVASILFCVGYWSRLSAIVLYVIMVSSLLRDCWVLEGGELVAVQLLFLCCFAPVGESLSLSTFLKGRAESQSLWPGGRPRPAWPLWLFRVLLAVIYGHSVAHKLIEQDYWRKGEALYNILLGVSWARPRFACVWLTHDPIICMVANYFSLLYQISLPILVWVRLARPWLALAGLMFHTAILILMSNSVILFSLCMISCMTLLIDNELWESWIKKMHAASASN